MATKLTRREQRAMKSTSKSPSQARMVWRAFLRHRLGNVGTVVVILLILSAAFAGFVSPYNYATQNSEYPYSPPTTLHFVSSEGFSLRPFVYKTTREFDSKTYAAYYVPDTPKRYYIRFFVHGSPYKMLGLFKTDLHLFGARAKDGSTAFVFLFGTDQYGRDLFTRTMIGGRISLAVGPFVILLIFPIAILIGGISGYYGGWTDMLVQRVCEVFMALPGLPVLLAVGAVLASLGLSAGMTFLGIIGALAFMSWAGTARVIRGIALSTRQMDYIAAAKAAGASDLRIIVHHITPSLTSYLIVAATLLIPGMMLTEAALSFLGYGIHEPMTSWGQLLNAANNVSGIQMHPWLLIPGIFIVIGVLAFNFMGDALRDAFDPYTNSR